MRKSDVLIPGDHPNPPEEHEVKAAWILAQHFDTIVEFLIPVDAYKTKTHDIVMDGRIWEIKSPKGNAKTTVGNQFKRSSKQRAGYIVFDAQRTRLKDEKIKTEIRREMRQRKSVKRVLFISKDESVVEIKS
jgi:hypothetical protein